MRARDGNGDGGRQTGKSCGDARLGLVGGGGEGCQDLLISFH